MQSVNNTTNVPLRAGAIYLGSNDDVLDYDSAYYSINADQNSQLEIYQSNDKKTYTITTYNYTGGAGIVVNDILLQQRYIYVTIRNSTGTNQTVLNFTMIYKNNGVIEGAVSVTNFPATQPVSGTVNSNVFDSTGANILSTGNSMNVFVTNTIQESNQAVNVCSGTGTTISSTGNFLDVNVANTGSIAVIANINQIGGDALYLGANSGTNSVPVVIASDQSTINTNANLYASSTALTVTDSSLNVADTVAEGYLGLLTSAGINITNTTLNVADTVTEGYLANLTYTGSALNCNIAGGNVGVTSFPATNTGGVLWTAATVSNTNTSNTVNMTGCFKNVYTVFVTSSDAVVCTVQYSPDNSTWFNTSNILTIPLSSSLALDFYSSAGYIRLIASGIAATSTISAWINHT